MKPLTFATWLLLACVAAGGMFTSTAHADNLYSTGFENPPFQLGPLYGQDGWNQFGGAQVLVENTVVKSGLQAVSVDGSVESQSGPYHEDPSSGPMVELQADLRIASSSVQTSWQFAGVGAGTFIGGIDTDPATNQMYLITSGFPVIGTFSRDVWHHLDFVFDFSTQTYSFAFDGTQLANKIAFCGSNSGCGGGNVPSFDNGFFDTFGGGNDFGYMDNYSASTVPEPGSLALLGTGVLGVFSVTRRRLEPRARARALVSALALTILFALTIVASPVAQAQTFAVLHSFKGAPDGSNPYGRLVSDPQKNLYGTTCLGGDYNHGAVFMVDKTGGANVLYSFTGKADGDCPVGGLVRDAAGNFYGTTEFGGAYQCMPYNNNSTCGTVFKLDTALHETVLHNFTGGDGQNPVAELLLDASGNLYGTTLNGGSNSGNCKHSNLNVNCGTVFEMDNTGTIIHEHQLGSGIDGGNPWGGVILDSSDNLYGTTLGGGANREGTVFKINNGFTQESLLYSFGAADYSACPNGTLLQDGLGNLYGATQGCYAYCNIGSGCGIVFKLDPTDKETTLYRFTGGADGSYPVAGLVRDLVGNLYGTTTSAGTYNGGTIYEIVATSLFGREKTLYDLNPIPDGSAPFAALLLDTENNFNGPINLYGTASTGGSGCPNNNCGTVFKLTP